jgi:hypothetical protein
MIVAIAVGAFVVGFLLGWGLRSRRRRRTAQRAPKHASLAERPPEQETPPEPRGQGDRQSEPIIGPLLRICGPEGLVLLDLRDRPEAVATVLVDGTVPEVECTTRAIAVENLEPAGYIRTELGFVVFARALAGHAAAGETVVIEGSQEAIRAQN